MRGLCQPQRNDVNQAARPERHPGFAAAIAGAVNVAAAPAKQVPRHDMGCIPVLNGRFAACTSGQKHSPNSCILPPMKFKIIPLLLVTALWTLLGTGCNTTRGVGKDIEKAGDKIQDAAR